VIKLHRGTVWAGVFAGAITQISDTLQYLNGKSNKKDYTIHTIGNVVSSLGVMAGIEYGALIGTAVFPGAGTVTGSILGGVIGEYLGRSIGHHTGNIVHRKQIVKVSGEHVTVTNNYIEQPE
jgi:outer membrane lipoprotein SlyB